MKVDIIVASVSGDAVAAKNAAKTIPIVMASVFDPVVVGLVNSLARPGSNVTGLSQMSLELTGKRLELLKEIVPKLSRVAVLWRPGGGASELAWKESHYPAQTLGLALHSMEVRSLKDFEKVFRGAIIALAA